MTLSILITTSQETKAKLDQLLAILLPQLKEKEDYEVYIEGEPVMQLGAKYNSLIKDAIGKYVWILNDSDIVSETAIEDIYHAIESQPDIVGITGATNISNQVTDWEVSIDSDNKLSVHSPMKRNLLIKKFRNKSIKAEEIWIKDMLKTFPFITEVKIDKPIIQKRFGLTIVK